MSSRILCAMTLLISLGLSFPVPFPAQSSVANEAYDQGQYGTAYQLARSLAEEGDVEAQVLLGRMFAWGRGVPRDQDEAVKWFRKAAEQGHGLAQSILGLRYAYGRGVPQDDTRAIEWFRRGTKRGNAVAQHNLGVMYENGKGIGKDDQQAAYWYRLAAEQGVPSRPIQPGQDVQRRPRSRPGQPGSRQMVPESSSAGTTPGHAQPGRGLPQRGGSCSRRPEGLCLDPSGDAAQQRRLAHP